MIATLSEGFASSENESSVAVLERSQSREIPQPVPRKRARRRNKAVRLHDVAQAAGVSIATVSMVVNGNARISPTTQKHVRRFIDRLGYRPSRAAQFALNGAGTGALVVLTPASKQPTSDTVHRDLLAGICNAAAARGRAVTFEQAPVEFLRSRRHVAMLEHGYAAGLLCVGFGDASEITDDFAGGKAPVVMVDAGVAGAAVDSVGVDYRTGAQQAMNYLLQLGHRRIALIASAGGSPDASEIADAYRAALAAHAIEPADGWIAEAAGTEAGGAAAAEQILRDAPDVTAVFAASDAMAIGALHAATKLGLSVPKDLSVVGVGNVPHAAFLNPPLTTVNVSMQDVGARACERLLERIDVGRGSLVVDRLPTHLVVRNSTAMARDLVAPAAAGESPAA